MPSVSALGSSLFGAALHGQRGDLFSPRGARPAADFSAKARQAAAAQQLEARRLAVTKGLESLAEGLGKLQFSSASRAGDFHEIRENRTRLAEKEIFRRENVLRSENILGIRDITEERDVIETRNVYETRNITETRNVYETRPVYEQRDIRENVVTGTRPLTPYRSIGAAGIDSGADFSIRVGTEVAATVRFVTNRQLSLTIDGQTTNFSFVNNDGTWRTALVDALGTIQNLDASLDGAGALRLQTVNGEDLAISEVANGLTDLSGSPLAALGLTARTYAGTVVGQEQVQVGTEQVTIGTEEVVIGTEEVVVGTEDVVVGRETVVIGSESYVAGTRQVVTGTRQVLDRVEQLDTGIVDSVLIGFSLRERSSATAYLNEGSRRRVVEGALALDGAIGPDAADNPFAGLRHSLGLQSFTAIATREERDAALRKVSAALQGFKPKAARSVPPSAPVHGGLGGGSFGAVASGSPYETTPRSTPRLLTIA